MGGILDTLAPAGNMFRGGISSFYQYAWVLYLFVGLAVFVLIFFMVKILTEKKKQWTHRLIIRRVGNNNLLNKDIDVIKMRRFLLIKRAEIYQLETPLLGGYLIPEMGEYSDTNEYSIIIDKNNRIYNNTGEYFCKDTSSISVSAKHAELDISRANLRAGFENYHQNSKRVEWSKLAQYAMVGILIIAVMIVSIKGIGAWGDAQASRAEVERSQASAMDSLASAMKTSESTMNTQVLILELLKGLYGTNNLQPVIRGAINRTIQ